MKTLTIKQILDINGALFLLRDTNPSLPAGLDFKIGRIITKIEPIVKDFGKKREELVKEYGVPSLEEGKEGMYSFTAENRGLYQEKLEEIFLIEKNVDITSIPFSVFSKLNVPFGFFIDLDPIIIDDTTDENN